MTKETLQKLDIPETPGVYFFKKGDTILYIGRATSLRDRVRSYFADDVISTRGSRIVDMVTLAEQLEWQEASSVLEAIILEANFIKKNQPRYNVKEKDDKSFNVVVVTKEDFPRVLVARKKDLEMLFPHAKRRAVFGPFPSSGLIREALRVVRKIFPYRDKCEPLQVAKSPTSGVVVKAKPCFERQIGLCPGVCTGEISAIEYRTTIIAKIEKLFSGRVRELTDELEREMQQAVKLQQFERAAVLRNRIFGLRHVKDVSLIKADKRQQDVERLGDFDAATHATHAALHTNPAIPRAPERVLRGDFRIEAYDTAHTAGCDSVGVMTVFVGREAAKSEYRTFKLRRTKAADDTGAVSEILSRRLEHAEWTLPDLIAVDGGITQLNAAARILAQKSFDIALVAVTKDERHKAKEIIFDKKMPSAPAVGKIVAEYEREILAANAEAHRFSLLRHRQARAKKFVGK